MNIFWLDEDIEKNVRYYCDKHVVKMIVEYAQLLSSSSRLIGMPQGYKLSHPKHPCTLWLLESQYNWIYLRYLTVSLHNEYQYRYGRYKVHKSFEVVRGLEIPPTVDNGFTIPPQCMPTECKCDNYVEAYRNYYNMHKQHIASWTGRSIPEWFNKDL